MRRPVAALAGVLALLLGGTVAPVRAQGTTSLHDIPWYAAHPAERNAILKFCQSDHRFSRNVDCLNAETGGTQAWGEESAKRAGLRGGPFDDLTNPQYWAANRLPRKGILRGCAQPIPHSMPDVCAAASQGEAIANASRGAR